MATQHCCDLAGKPHRICYTERRWKRWAELFFGMTSFIFAILLAAIVISAIA